MVTAVAEIFDFDEWSSLARTAPDEFEDRRHRVIEQIISSSTDIRRLRGLQCRIDLERTRARTPLKACLRLSSMMWDSLYACRSELNRFVRTVEGKPVSPRPAVQARIIPFVRVNRNIRR